MQQSIASSFNEFFALTGASSSTTICLSTRAVRGHHLASRFSFDLDFCFLANEAQFTDFKTENVRDPMFSHDFENLCWLQNQARGPHFQCSKLMMVTSDLRQLSRTFFLF